VRLVVPLLVLDELDDKTFSANNRLSKRADKVLREFDRFMDQVVESGTAEIRPTVTLEVLLDEDDHRRRTNADTELLDRAEFLYQIRRRLLRSREGPWAWLMRRMASWRP
jgi:predicted ribonuclease YlaK